MTDPRVPLVVVSGYLGAGKTTLINRLLTEEHGLRLLVLVNDFGAINIDAGLIADAGGDTIALSNGCVCCTMGADLFMALGDALDRHPRPDALVVEASGIADPGRIAEVARSEPDLAYSGIVTVVDPDMFPALARDDMIGPQVRQQVETADLVFVRSAGGSGSESSGLIADLTRAPIMEVGGDKELAPLLFGLEPASVAALSGQSHPAYVVWHASSGTVASRAALDLGLAERPHGLFRLKGTVECRDGTIWEVQVVGPRAVVKRARGGGPTTLVGLGPAASIRHQQIAEWWELVTQED